AHRAVVLTGLGGKPATADGAVRQGPGGLAPGGRQPFLWKGTTPRLLRTTDGGGNPIPSRSVPEAGGPRPCPPRRALCPTGTRIPVCLVNCYVPTAGRRGQPYQRSNLGDAGRPCQELSIKTTKFLQILNPTKRKRPNGR